MNEQATVKRLCRGRVTTAPEDEARVWDHKADDADYQVWTDRDPDKWDEAADDCANYFYDELETVWNEYTRFVEIGCGVGRLTHRLASKDNAPQFIGLDISPKMIDIAKEHQRPNETFIVNDGRTLEHINQVDAIYSMLIFQHIPRHAFFTYLDEIGRALKPGGMFCFQYVEGDSENRLAHETSFRRVADHLSSQSLAIITANNGFMEPRWTWITGVKRG